MCIMWYFDICINPKAITTFKIVNSPSLTELCRAFCNLCHLSTHYPHPQETLIRSVHTGKFSFSVYKRELISHILYVWPLSLSIVILSYIYAVIYVNFFFILLLSSIPYATMYSFTYWRIVGSFPVWSYYK